jgi:hypothetical protein
MALIRGIKGKCPCPRCLIAEELLFNLRAPFKLRTTEEAKALLVKASQARYKYQQEEILQPVGLRNVQVSD